MEGDDLVDRDVIFEDQEDSITSTPDSSFASDEATEASMPASKKRRGEKTKVVLLKICGDGSARSKTEVYPPPDSCSWRKYGQKPIKGSPYPRGYYRCSSSKGCPSRKQVERSSLDPTMLQITYSYQHNHPLPTTTPKHHRHPTSGTSTTSTDTVQESLQPDLEPDNSGFYEFTAELDWFSNMGSTSMLNSPTFVGPKWVDADVALMVPIGEEDQSLFGDLGELPECSVVFRRPCSARG